MPATRTRKKLDLQSIGDDDALTFAELAVALGHKHGRAFDKDTVRKWVNDGCRGVRLESWQLAGHCYTSLAAFERFNRAIADQRSSQREKKPTARQQKKAVSEKARRVRERHGLK